MPRSALVLSAIVAATVAQAILVNAHNDLRLDEPFMALALGRPSSLPATFVHDNVPLAYLLLLAWTRLFGSSAFALRALSAAAHGGAVAFTAAAARRSASPAAAWLAALLVGFSVPIGLEHAAMARPYALVELFAAMTLWAARRADAMPATRGPAVVLLAAHLAGLFTHPIFLFACAASSLAGVLCGRKRLLLGAVPLLAVVVYLGVWWPVLRQTLALPTTSWMTRPAFADVVAGGTALWGMRNSVVLAALAVVLVAVRGRVARQAFTRHVAFAALTAAFIVGGVLMASQFKPVYFAARTPILVLPALSIVLAAVFIELGPPLLSAIVAVVVIFGSARYTIHAWRQPDPAPTRASLGAVAARAACGDTLIAAGLSYAALTYYAPAAGLPRCITIEPFPADVRNHPGWLDMSAGSAARLRSEAPEMATRLPAGGTIWIFLTRQAIGMEAGEAIVSEVAQRRLLSETLPLRGTFFDEVQMYAPAPRRVR